MDQTEQSNKEQQEQIAQLIESLNNPGIANYNFLAALSKIEAELRKISDSLEKISNK